MISEMKEFTTLETFDPFGKEFRENPELFYPKLIAASPFFIEMEGVPSAVVASYRQATAVLRDYKSFSSLKPKNLPGMQRIDFFNGLPIMNYSDPPDHTRRRKVVNAAFTPVRIKALVDAASQQIDEALEAAAAKGRFDAIEDFATPLARATILDRFVRVTDPEARQTFLDYFKAVPLLDKVKFGEPKPAAFLDAWDRGQAFCLEQLALARRGDAPDSLIALIAQAVIDGALDEREMMAMTTVLMIGGVSTTAAAVGSSFRFLAQNPDVADRIRQNPELAAPCLEEAIRLASPISLVLRFGTEDSMIGDVKIPKYMPVYVMLNAANRDPAVFEEPDRFNIDRPNVREHIGFGFGQHTCIGNTVTRSLVPVCIQRLTARFKHISMSDVPNALVVGSTSPRARHVEHLFLDVA